MGIGKENTCMVKLSKVIKKSVADRLIDIAVQKKGSSPDSALALFIDYCLKAFDVSHTLKTDDYLSWVESVVKTDEDYKDIMIEWLTKVNESLTNNKPYDFFGATYEELFQSRGKATTLGQFFTPINVAQLMASLSYDLDVAEEIVRVYDCCSGSGRLLLGHVYMRLNDKETANKHKYFYVADDIDLISCKMSALNLMVHSCYGCVCCRDVLLNDAPHTVYLVNEVQVPYQSMVMSVRCITGDEAASWWNNGGIYKMEQAYNLALSKRNEI